MNEDMSVSEFIAKYGKPYDPENDSYEKSAFDINFDNMSKNNSIYNIHNYWTKQDPYVVRKFIEHYTKPGDIVLDAFCGAGITGVASLMCGRYGILSDISPACVHISKNYTTPSNRYKMEINFNSIINIMNKEIKWLYNTKCANCGNTKAHLSNIIYSDVLECPRCKGENLFAGGERWRLMKEGKKETKIKCLFCDYQFTKSSSNFLRIRPIEIIVRCGVCNKKGEDRSKSLDKDDWDLYNKIENLSYDDIYNKYWFPKDVSFVGDEPKRNIKRGITHPYQMFSTSLPS